MPGIYLHGWDAVNSKWVKCLVNADGKLIINPAGFLENPPTEDQALKAPTSEWAFDHDADANAHHTPPVAGDFDHNDLAGIGTDDHHAKYTDAESRTAINDIIGADGKFDKDLDLDNHQLLWAKNSWYKDAWGGGGSLNFFFQLSTLTWNTICRNAVGTQVDHDHRIYNGTAYASIIRTDTFQAALDDYLENPPTEDSANTAPTSEWAFDHDADAAAHHAKYTDAEALAAPSNNELTLTTGTYLAQTVAGKATVYLNTAGGNIQIEGLADGYNGQIIRFVRTAFTNSVILIDASVTGGVDEGIYTRSRGDETQAAGTLGGFVMVHLAGFWQVDRTIT